MSTYSDPTYAPDMYDAGWWEGWNAIMRSTSRLAAASTSTDMIVVSWLTATMGQGDQGATNREFYREYYDGRRRGIAAAALHLSNVYSLTWAI